MHGRVGRRTGWWRVVPVVCLLLSLGVRPAAGQPTPTATPLPSPTPVDPPGLLWVRQRVPVGTAGLYAVAAVDERVAWAVGDAGTVLATTDGETWVRQVSGTTQPLNGVAAVSRSTAWAVGAAGTVLRTDDGGATWRTQASGVGDALVGVAALSSSVAWAVGAGGTILATTDGGASWRRQASGTSWTLRAVAAVSASTAWAVGGDFAFNPVYRTERMDRGVVLGTTDGGATWVAQTDQWFPAAYGVVAASPTSALVVGHTYQIGCCSVPLLARTTDGVRWVDDGMTVTGLPHGASVFELSAVAAASSRVMWAVTPYGMVLKTTDGGATWRVEATPSRVYLGGVAAGSESVGWAVGSTGWPEYSGTIYRTTGVRTGHRTSLPVGVRRAGLND
jgi:photosystem II stability/assembly factor-like uncharacterized protein